MQLSLQETGDKGESTFGRGTQSPRSAVQPRRYRTAALLTDWLSACSRSWPYPERPPREMSFPTRAERPSPGTSRQALSQEIHFLSDDLEQGREEPERPEDVTIQLLVRQASAEVKTFRTSSSLAARFPAFQSMNVVQTYCRLRRYQRT